MEGPPLKIATEAARFRAGQAKPYSVDWRFLPDWMLVGKDFVRQQLVGLSNATAHQALTQPLWLKLIGRRTLNSLTAAKMLFVHVPRTGGTSISLHLYGRNLPHFSMRYYRSVFGDHLSGIPTFAITRDPVERFISGYNFVRAGGTQLMASDRFSALKLSRLRSLESYVDYFSAFPEQRAQILPFATQARFVVDEHDRVAVDRLFAMNGHLGFAADLYDWLQTPDLPRVNMTAGDHPIICDRLRSRIEHLYSEDTLLYRAVMARGGSAQLCGQPLNGLHLPDRETALPTISVDTSRARRQTRIIPYNRLSG